MRTYGAKEAMNSFDELTKKAVKTISFYEICTSNNINFLRKKFKEIYTQYKEKYDFDIQSSNDLVCIGLNESESEKYIG